MIETQTLLLAAEVHIRNDALFVANEDGEN
jgi:hypothetical protein